MFEEHPGATGGTGKKVTGLMGSRVTYWGTFLCLSLLIYIRRHLPQVARDQNSPCLWFPLPSVLRSESYFISVKGISSKSQGVASWEAGAGQHRAARDVGGWAESQGEGASRQFPYYLDRTRGPGGRSGEEGKIEVVSASQSPGAILSGQEPCWGNQCGGGVSALNYEGLSTSQAKPEEGSSGSSKTGTPKESLRDSS